MILLTQVNSWKTKRPEKYVSLAGDHQVYTLADGDYFFLNTNRISEMVAKNDGSTKFLFSQAPDDHRCSPDIIECNTSIADIEAAANVVYPSKFVILPIFPTNDITRVHVDTPVNTVVELEDIAYVYATRRDLVLDVTHCVYYDKSFRRIECILNYSFAEIQSAMASLTQLIDKDGNIYTTVVIGSQEWIVGNLRTTTYADGTAIPNLTDTTQWVNDVTGAYCWYDNNIIYKETYGGLYSWYAATSARGLAAGQFTEGGVVSAGWKIPTMADWAILANAIGGAAVAGAKLKEAGTAHWAWAGGTNDYGFRMMGNGNRWVDEQNPLTDSFLNMLIFSDTWSQDTNGIDPLEGNSVYIASGSDVFSLYQTEKYGGMAVRAMRDI
jgi:uncharacterized protein (TIGR02145 family)